MIGLAVAAALVLAAPAATPRPKAAPRPKAGARAKGAPARARAVPAAAATAGVPDRAGRPRGLGYVVQVTSRRAYLDVGAEDGLAPGAELALLRDGAPVGTCRVEDLAPHAATCAGAPARRGDAFRFAAAAPPPAPKALPALVPAGELARRARVVSAAPLAQVVFTRDPSVGAETRRRSVDVALSHVSWTATGAGALQSQRADLLVRELEILRGVRLDLDARAERWSPADRTRFRTDEGARLYVWQAQLTAEPGGRDLAIAAGRVLPWGIPGATLFDGASATLRRGRLEAGLFGGAVPEPDTLEPTLDRATAGGFWRIGGEAAGGILRHEGRVAYVRSPELGDRAEVTAAASAWLGRWLDLSGEAQLGFGGTVTAPGSLDAARVDLGTRPAPRLSLVARFEYLGLDHPQPLVPAAFPGRSGRAEAFASLALGPVRLGAVGGTARDLESELDRSWVGPELSLPSLLGGRASLSTGYLEERGWLEGRSAWVQLGARPVRSLRVLARASWARQTTLGADQDEVGFLASGSADLGGAWRLRLSVSGRAAEVGDLGGTSASGLVALASLAARY